eukprot:TRINITY_DN614_c0_g1_i2.p1 TRINITY_DN614_c0_g1~~TRINITY_DN614_c0_g1_i2.p1  ORF type:complete len:218 (-),score=51.04 TRINITY_DN614_c0_g1_i2:249-812(-)
MCIRDRGYTQLNFCMLIVYMIFSLYSIVGLFMRLGKEVQSWYLFGTGIALLQPKHIVGVILFLFYIASVTYVFYAYREFKAFFMDNIEGPPYYGGATTAPARGGGFPMPGGQPVGSSSAPPQRDAEQGGGNTTNNGGAFKAFKGKGVTIGGAQKGSESMQGSHSPNKAFLLRIVFAQQTINERNKIH